MKGRVNHQLKNSAANFATTGTITNLYDLIGALNKEIQPNHDNLITAIVADLIGTGHIKWIRPRKKFKRFDC
ncbi:MAG: hypothetical protein PVG96_13365 [Desulfobacterales bacterium]|jgi:hypothetical protein